MPITLGHWWLILAILVVVLIFGPRRLPELGNAVGKAIREFRSGVNEIRDEVSHGGENQARATTSTTAETPEPAPQTEVHS